MTRIRSAFSLAALAAAAMGWCAAAHAQTAPVTFSLDFRALGRHAAWYVALDKGYYKQAGLEVTIIPSQGTAQAIQSVESGAAQFTFSDVAGLVAARANSAATAKMVAVIYQKAPYAIFSLKSGANVTRPEQLENLEIASGAGSFTQKVIEAFMRFQGAEGRHGQVHQHRPGGAGRHAGRQANPGDRDLRHVDARTWSRPRARARRRCSCSPTTG